MHGDQTSDRVCGSRPATLRLPLVTGQRRLTVKMVASTSEGLISDQNQDITKPESWNS